MQLVREIINGRTTVTEEEVVQIVGMFCDLYKTLPNVIEIPDNRLFVAGDLHGELESLRSIIKIFNSREDYRLIFLGDYVDRGPQQVETFNLAMALAIAYPDRVIMLRGNHESVEVVLRYGFYEAAFMAYSATAFNEYIKCFDVLPLAATSTGGLFCCHGGVPEDLQSINRLQTIDRSSRVFSNTIAFQLLWNDPREADFEFGPSERGEPAKTFGRHAFDTFCKELGVRMMIRGHEVVPEGVRSMFNGRLLSVFSASYGGLVTPMIVQLDNLDRWTAVPLDTD